MELFQMTTNDAYAYMATGACNCKFVIVACAPTTRGHNFKIKYFLAG